MASTQTLAGMLLKAATLALARTDNAPETERCLKPYRDDALAVTIAVLDELSNSARQGKKLAIPAVEISSEMLREITTQLRAMPAILDP